MYDKKSQITLFLIIGIFILILLAVLFYIKGSDMDFGNDTPIIKEHQILYDAVEGCLLSSSESALVRLGKSGGYAVVPDNSFKDIESYEIPYYFIDGKEVHPSIEDLENSLDVLIEEEFEICIDDVMNSIDYIGYEKRDIDVSSSIADNKLILELNLDVDFIVSDSRILLDKVVVVVKDVYLYEIENFVSEYMQQQINYPNSVCVSCLLELGDKYGLDYELIRLNDVVLFKLIFDDADKYEFFFANRYEPYSCDDLSNAVSEYFLEYCVEKKIEENGLTLKVEDISDMQAEVGEEFFYNVVASGNGLEFMDDSYIFDIDKTSGYIRFVPQISDIGNHSIKITVYDELGKMEYEYFDLEVLT